MAGPKTPMEEMKMHMTSNPFLAAFAGFGIAYAAWLNALHEASVREAFRDDL